MTNTTMTPKQKARWTIAKLRGEHFLYWTAPEQQITKSMMQIETSKVQPLQCSCGVQFEKGLWYLRIDDVLWCHADGWTWTTCDSTEVWL